MSIGCGTNFYSAGRRFFSRSGEELAHLVGTELTSSEALVSATGIAAEALGAEEEIDGVEVGMQADQVGLGADPTDR